MRDNYSRASIPGQGGEVVRKVHPHDKKLPKISWEPWGRPIVKEEAVRYASIFKATGLKRLGGLDFVKIWWDVADSPAQVLETHVNS